MKLNQILILISLLFCIEPIQRKKNRIIPKLIGRGILQSQNSQKNPEDKKDLFNIPQMKGVITIKDYTKEYLKSEVKLIPKAWKDTKWFFIEVLNWNSELNAQDEFSLQKMPENEKNLFKKHGIIKFNGKYLPFGALMFSFSQIRECNVWNTNHTLIFGINKFQHIFQAQFDLILDLEEKSDYQDLQKLLRLQCYKNNYHFLTQNKQTHDYQYDYDLIKTQGRDKEFDKDEKEDKLGLNVQFNKKEYLDKIQKSKDEKQYYLDEMKKLQKQMADDLNNRGKKKKSKKSKKEKEKQAKKKEKEQQEKFTESDENNEESYLIQKPKRNQIQNLNQKNHQRKSIFEEKKPFWHRSRKNSVETSESSSLSPVEGYEFYRFGRDIKKMQKKKSIKN